MQMPTVGTVVLTLALCSAMPLVARAPNVAGPSHEPGRSLPGFVAWAWEREEDLRFLEGHVARVAILVATLDLRERAVIEHPRRQPIKVPSGIRTIGVVRIEARHPEPRLDDDMRRRVRDAILRFTASPLFDTIQIDFDAAVSARPFYRSLLADLRAALPTGRRLSMTALASWCLGDPWVQDLPVDEIVPMVFQMGADARRIRNHLARGGDFQPVCRSAIGVATDESLPPLAFTRQTYVFHGRSWDVEAFSSLVNRTLGDRTPGRDLP